ncbi:hypothetical protein, partial [Pseudomonas sp. FW306-2-11AD]|uniref:hypothetical protein n=1 Tax=Pseudomonas sp. FW306-2-11AD TaxID=2070665 RepID=UPI001C472E0A
DRHANRGNPGLGRTILVDREGCRPRLPGLACQDLGETIGETHLYDKRAHLFDEETHLPDEEGSRRSEGAGS